MKVVKGEYKTGDIVVVPKAMFFNEPIVVEIFIFKDITDTAKFVDLGREFYSNQIPSNI